MPTTPKSTPTGDARFNNFVLLQAQNAGLFLGQLPHPLTGKHSVNLIAAESVIESLEMLAVKTTGNLTNDEQTLLTKAIENLTHLYKEAKDLG
jgi:hypothetical protein